jgi:hypothetical protein
LLPNHTLGVCRSWEMFAKDFCHGVLMSPDPQRFARRVLAAFTAAGNRTEAQIAKAEGPSTSTMTKLRKVAEGERSMTEPREPTWTKIENAARWQPGSARLVWEGGDPVPLPDNDQGSRDEEALEALREEVRLLRLEVRALKRDDIPG